MTTILDILQTVIYLLGFIGLGYWTHLLNNAIRAQDQTIRIQADGIKAQGDMMKTLKAAFETLDTPKMLERFKAQEEIIERVKNIALEEQKITMAKQQEKSTDLMVSLLGGVLELYRASVPYIPIEKRTEIINAAHLPSIVKDGLRELSNVAPDHSLEAFFANVGRPPTLPAEGQSEAIAALLAPPPKGNQNV